MRASIDPGFVIGAGGYSPQIEKYATDAFHARSRMKVRWIILPGLLLALFFPRFGELEAYQTSLWTAGGGGSSSDFRFKSGDVTGLRKWKRLRLGFPSGAITIDTSPGDRVVQGRSETPAIFLNLVIVGFPTVFLATIFFVHKRVSTPADDEQLEQDRSRSRDDFRRWNK
jgi:hypothetical protein